MYLPAAVQPDEGELFRRENGCGALRRRRGTQRCGEEQGGEGQRMSLHGFLFRVTDIADGTSRTRY